MILDDFFHKLFGDDIYGENNRPPQFQKDDPFNFKKFDSSIRGSGGEEDNLRNFSAVPNFKVFYDPYEMHKIFQEKMNEMIKIVFEPNGFPTIEGSDIFNSQEEVPPINEKQNPKDHYLKPGTEKYRSRVGEREDEKSIDTWWLGSSLPLPGPEDKSFQSKPNVFSSFKSVMRKTVVLPDGTIKTEEIIQNSDGTEQRTECQSIPEGNNTPLFDSPWGNFAFPGFFKYSEIPEPHKFQLLKPGYEKFNPNIKIDLDLDKEIEQSGVNGLPFFSDESQTKTISPSPYSMLKCFTRRTVTLPNGVIESEETIQNPDCTTQRTITHTLPDGTATTLTGPLKDAGTNQYGQNELKKLEESNKQGLFGLRIIKDFIDIMFK